MKTILFFCTLLLCAVITIQGCCPSSETVIEDKPVPVVIKERTIRDTVWTDKAITDSLIQAILVEYCKGETEQDTLGFYYVLQYRYQLDQNKKLKERVTALITQKERIDTVIVRDTTQVSHPIVNEFGFWDKAGLVLKTVGAIAIVLVFLGLGMKFGLLKLPL